MLTAEDIALAVRRAVEAASSPARVILFGSYARGDADEGSDLDMIVVEREVADKGAELVRLNRAVGWIGKGVDILLYSEQEFAERSLIPGTAPYWASQEGRIVHDGYRG